MTLRSRGSRRSVMLILGFWPTSALAHSEEVLLVPVGILYAYGEPILKSGWEQRMLVSTSTLTMDTMPMDKKRMRVCSLVPAQGWTTPPSCGTVGR